MDILENTMSAADVTAAFKEIADCENDAAVVLSGDMFCLQANGRDITSQITTEDCAVMLRIVLRAVYERIRLQVVRLAAAGITLDRFAGETPEAWVQKVIDAAAKRG